MKFLVAHDTGNPGSTAANNVRYYERTRDEASASAHVFVDDREIIECIPALEASPPEKAWHVLYSVPTDNQLYGYDANDAAVGVEYCYGDRIDADEAYRKFTWVLAYACYKHGLDPKKSIVGHFFLDPRRKTDPVTGLAHSRRTYDQLLRDVVAEYEACAGQPIPPPPLSQAGTVTASVKLNIRRGAPHTRAPIHQVVPPGTQLTYVRVVENGELVNGNPVWYADGSDNFFWSGGVKASS
ncbi:MAG TPA: peptidoglycan recognition family protein [Candidatus Acidoferrum sp.]|nr:peptidoglycan recognition family protein [Candidatus Acidoferrum sp.]